MINFLRKHIIQQCKKKGHRRQKRAFKVYKKSTFFVAVLHLRTETYCKRCGKVFKKSDKYITGYTGVTWPRSMMEEFDEKGWIRA